MKHLISTFLLLAGVFCCPTLMAETVFQADGNHYQIGTGGDYVILVCPEVSAASNSNGNIPAAVEFEGKSYPVKRIGSKAFYGNPGLTSVSIPETVVYVGESAFQGCSKLKEVKIGGATMRRIGKSAFAQCVSLAEINLPSTIVTIGERAFMDCQSMTEIQLPDNVRVIERETFAHCGNLVNPNISPAVEKIDAKAFYGCKKLISLPVLKNITEIGIEAFGLCESIECVSVLGPAMIHESAFSGCANLTEVELGADIKQISFAAFAPCEKLESVWCMSAILPDANSASFSAEKATLYVPEGSIAKYKSCRPWLSFREIEKLPTVTEIVIVEDE